MKKITFLEKEYEVKDFLTSSEKIFIMNQTLDAYDNGMVLTDGERQPDEIVGYNKNPISKDITFMIVVLNIVCPELLEHDLDILEQHDIIDTIEDVVDDVTYLRYDINNIVDKRESIEYTLSNFLDKLVEKVPTTKDIQKLTKSMLKEVSNPKNKESIDRIKEILGQKI